MRRLPALGLLLLLLLPLAALFLAGSTGEWAAPLRNSLVTAAAASILATICGTAAGMGLRGGFLGRSVAIAIMVLPLLLPPPVPAAALLLLAEETGHGAGRPGAALWHAMLAAPLVALIVWTALGAVSPALFRAAAACGASPDMAARRLSRPRLLPAIAGGALLAFALSLGESSVAFLLGAETLGAASLPGGVAAGSAIAPLLVAGVLALALLRGPARRGG
ncbi:ABC transporter permease subunit [Roseomonas sp. SSH11]|uniref:ABC transporter permease subunit n=1 Tax=Pararoseomonas baculiformis TaxID=2820812 RepID=A0ABS4A889_9PROT|nr:ABC transporter permease subunit [Pararoseomonas baculiformis]MBP0443207.1 ABC transporter permease subunit [Pararoseomonas baculiformis]